MIRSRQIAIIEKYYQNFKDSLYDDVPAIHSEKLLEFQKTSFGEYAYQQNEIFNRWAYKVRPGNKRYYCVQNEQVVGQQSAINIQIRLDSEVFNAAWAVDLRIRPEWKMKGLGVALVGQLIHEYDVLLGFGVSDDAYKMFVRQGWLDLGLIDALVKPLSMAGYNDKAPNASFIAWFKYCAALFVSTLSNYYRGMVHFILPNEFRKIGRFTQEHEKLINNICSADVIQINKNKDYYNWRFIDFPGSGKYENYELVKNATPVAFFSIAKATYEHMNVLAISEIQAKKSDLGIIVDEIVRMALVKKVSKITYSGLDHEVLRVLKSRFFYSRPYGERFLVFTKRSELKSIIMDKRNWKISSSDSDAEYYLLHNNSLSHNEYPDSNPQKNGRCPV